MTMAVEVYNPQHPIRVVTATSLFDGHDASINIMRRILQEAGVEVPRQVDDVVIAGELIGVGAVGTGRSDAVGY